ncbi:MAG TPA: type IV toxin-antitoxin system AbiEi family antitoxin domain-containing protein [Acidimicrobiia bacterium]|nr:type IV toxin-antitoxin system AbiEi family antitoxin domain-containing protein [Acidimicrobiia bacterium]
MTAGDRRAYAAVDPHRTADRGLKWNQLFRHALGMWDEGLLRSQASQRHGLISRGELTTLGITDATIKYRIDSGRLEHLYPGVYYMNATPATWKTDVLAGVMAAGPDALASHRTAAVLWELDAVFSRMIEVTVPFNEEPVPTGVILHRTRRANPGTVVDGIPITPPDKTLMDLSSILGERTLFKAARSAVRKGIITVKGLDDAVRLYGGRGVKGTRKMRRVVLLVADDESGSVAEIDLGYIIMDAPIPPPVQQLKIRLPNGEHAYPDYAWPPIMRIVEADGFTAHSTPEQLEHDLWRQNQLMDLGWDIRRFTAQKIRENPEEVRAEIIRFINRPI